MTDNQQQMTREKRRGRPLLTSRAAEEIKENSLQKRSVTSQAGSPHLPLTFTLTGTDNIPLMLKTKTQL